MTASDTAEIAIYADALPAVSAELAFLLDTTAVRSATISENAFAGPTGAAGRCWMDGDTVRVSLRARRPTRIVDGPLAIIRAATRPVPSDTVFVPIRWVGRRGLGFDGALPLAGDTSCLAVAPLYGDVTLDGAIGAEDLAWILQTCVGSRPDLPQPLADVTMSGDISAFDAALVGHRIDSSTFHLPLQPGSIASFSSKKPRSLRFVPRDSLWALVADDADSICAVDITLGLPTADAVTIIGPQLLAARQDGTRLFAAFLLDHEHGDEPLFSIDTPYGPPRVVSIRFNEGFIPVGEIVHSAEFALAQNAPIRLRGPRR